MGTYGSEQVTQYMGFGATPGTPIPLIPASGLAEDSMFFRHFRPSMAMLERAMGFRLDRFAFSSAVSVADTRIEMQTTTVEPGTIDGLRLCLEGYDAGVLRVQFEAIYKASSAAPADWPHAAGSSEWRLRLHGNPGIETVCKLGDAERGARADMVMTAAHAVNAVPSLVASGTGVKTFLDLPPFAAQPGS